MIHNLLRVLLPCTRDARRVSLVLFRFLAYLRFGLDPDVTGRVSSLDLTNFDVKEL